MQITISLFSKNICYIIKIKPNINITLKIDNYVSFIIDNRLPNLSKLVKFYILKQIWSSVLPNVLESIKLNAIPTFPKLLSKWLRQ